MSVRAKLDDAIVRDALSWAWLKTYLARSTKIYRSGSELVIAMPADIDAEQFERFLKGAPPPSLTPPCHPVVSGEVEAM